MKVGERIRTHISWSVTVFFFENRAVFLDNVEKYCRARQATDDKMVHVHCCIPKVKNTRSECVIIIAFPRQKWLCERVSKLSYLYIVIIRCNLHFCLFSSGFSIKILYEFLLPIVFATYTAHLILLNLIFQVIFGDG